MQTPTIEAIETAIARADAMHGTYTCEPIPGMPGKYYVQHNTKVLSTYIVDTRPGMLRCTCPQFEKAAVCKHCAFAKQNEQIAEWEAEQEAIGELSAF
jgi:hypothetical protein